MCPWENDILTGQKNKRTGLKMARLKVVFLSPHIRSGEE